MQTFRQIGTAVGKLVETKNRAYGSSFSTSGRALQLLFPQGISTEQMADALLLTRIWDKMQRIATHRDALGENPYRDIAGYGILGVHMHQHSKEGSTGPCGSASDAERASREQSASTEHVAPAQTTQNASDKSEPSFRQPCEELSPNTSASTDALALTATDRASRLAAVLENAEEDNGNDKCAGCGYVRLLAQRRIFQEQRILFCSLACADDFKRLVEALL